MQVVLIIMSVLMLAGCAGSDRRTFDDVAAHWGTRSAADLKAVLGEPTAIAETTDGFALLSYRTSHERDRLPFGRFVRACELEVVVDEAGGIRDMGYRGSSERRNEDAERVCYRLYGSRLSRDMEAVGSRYAGPEERPRFW